MAHETKNECDGFAELLSRSIHDWLQAVRYRVAFGDHEGIHFANEIDIAKEALNSYFLHGVSKEAKEHLLDFAGVLTELHRLRLLYTMNTRNDIEELGQTLDEHRENYEAWIAYYSKVDPRSDDYLLYVQVIIPKLLRKRSR